MEHYLLHDIGVAIIVATVLGLIAHWLRQPIILGYLIAGALAGPKLGFSLIKDEQSIKLISELGLILLLFIIGLELNLKAILGAGRQLLIAGFGQFVACAAIGVGLFAAMGYGLAGHSADGLYLALLCALSSTAVVVKMLYDKAELDTLPGRITLGILVIQDIYAIFILAFQPNFANPSLPPMLKALGGTALLLVAGFAVSRYVLQRVFASIAKAPEMVVAISIGWCAAVAALAGALGVSMEMGALVAGLSIGAFPYSIHVVAKTLPLRDFFLTLFFVSLGMQITPLRGDMVLAVAGLVLFVVASRFLSVYPLLTLAGGGRRTAFITSLNTAQISEFSLVIASLGVQFGHISANTVALMIYAMAVTAVLSSYAIRYNHELYLAFDRALTRFGRPRGPDAAADAAAGAHPTIAILGFHRAARALVDALERRNPEYLKEILVVDFNPERLAALRRRGVRGMFGDIASHDTLTHSHLEHATVILSTIPDMMLKGVDNLSLVRSCRAIAPHATIIATADHEGHEHQLRAEGATIAINPYDLTAARAANLIEQALLTRPQPVRQNAA